MKKFTALLLALALVLSMVSIAVAEEPRHIVIGTTWDIFYDSTHEDVYANPGYTGDLAQEMMFEKVRQVEEKWNVTFEFLNMTYSGSKESINTSIVAGSPDVDVYMVGMAVAAPAIANGYAVDLREILPADHPVLNGTDEVLSYVDVGNGDVSLLIANKKENMVADTKPLGFNLQMIEEANLEDPRDLVERGEWTWDKFIEYCQVLTQDLDGDGIIDVYGFGGWPEDYLSNLLMSNGTSIASSPRENLTSPEVDEVLQFLQDLNVTYGVMYPIPAENGDEALGWWYGVVAKDVELQNYNFNIMYQMGLKQQFEMWNNLDVSMELTALINGEYTVAQYQEMFKQPVQDAITLIMGE